MRCKVFKPLAQKIREKFLAYYSVVSMRLRVYLMKVAIKESVQESSYSNSDESFISIILNSIHEGK